MPARTFCYDYLKQLVRADPSAPRRELAIKVTEHMRGEPLGTCDAPGKHRLDYPMIKDFNIGAVLSRYRATWLDGGGMPPLPPRKGGSRTQPFDNVPEQYCRDTLLRRLRMMTNIARDAPNLPKAEVELALNLARQLQRDRQVIDLHPHGEPYKRDARPDELDATGEIISFTARYPGLTQQMWTMLDPEGCRIAALHWLPLGRELGPGPSDLRLRRDAAS